MRQCLDRTATPQFYISGWLKCHNGFYDVVSICAILHEGNEQDVGALFTGFMRLMTIGAASSSTVLTTPGIVSFKM